MPFCHVTSTPENVPYGIQLCPSPYQHDDIPAPSHTTTRPPGYVPHKSPCMPQPCLILVPTWQCPSPISSCHSIPWSCHPQATAVPIQHPLGDAPALCHPATEPLEMPPLGHSCALPSTHGDTPALSHTAHQTPCAPHGTQPCPSQCPCSTIPAPSLGMPPAPPHPTSHPLEMHPMSLHATAMPHPSAHRAMSHPSTAQQHST